MPGITAPGIVAAVAGVVLAASVALLLRSRGRRLRARDAADALVRDACLAAIAFAQKFRIAVQAAAAAKDGAPPLAPFAPRMRELAAAAGPFPARDEIEAILREISGEADRLSRGEALALSSHPKRSVESWAGDREMWIRLHCRTAFRGRRGAWQDPPIEPSPVVAA